MDSALYKVEAESYHKLPSTARLLLAGKQAPLQISQPSNSSISLVTQHKLLINQESEKHRPENDAMTNNASTSSPFISPKKTYSMDFCSGHLLTT